MESKNTNLPLIAVPSVRNYYVDEAGDSALFNAKGKVIVGTHGCSSHFILGLLSVFEPISLESDLKALRQSILADPDLRYYGKYQKPIHGFHANDDLPEVRKLVFELLVKHRFRFFAIVKDKLEAVKYVRQMNRNNPAYRYNGDRLYDNLACALFETRLHKNYEHNVHFASRGHADRTEALKTALFSVRERAMKMYNPTSTGSVNILPPTTPLKNVNLQAVDYCVWALQRFYVKQEELYLQKIWPSVSMIGEMDSKTGKKRGIVYTKKEAPFRVQIVAKDIGLK